MKNNSVLLTLLFAFSMAFSMNAQEREIFKVVENMPSFPGCENMKASQEVIRKCAQEKLMEFVYNNITYPPKAKAQKMEATVTVRYVVNKKGLIGDVEILEDLDGQFSATLKAMMKKMPRWNPGTQRSRPVAVQMHLPVMFKLDREPREDPVPVKEPRKVYKNDGHAKVRPFPNGGDVPPPPPPPPPRRKKTVVPDHHKNNPNMEVPPPPPPPPPPPAQEEEPFIVVEQMPRFAGCEGQGLGSQELKKCADNKLSMRLFKSLKYPAEARKNGVEGTVVLQFVVEKDGSLSNIVCVRDPGAGCGEEAVRVFQELADSGDRWIPGRQRGKAVRVKYTMPVKFKL